MILNGKSAIIIPFYIRRCVGMADEGDSKSLVLITRVGSTPTTGIKKELPQLVWGSFLFYLRRVSGSNSTARISNKECYAQSSSRLTMASIRSKHSSIWRTSVNWVRARSRLWPGRAVWK